MQKMYQNDPKSVLKNFPGIKAATLAQPCVLKMMPTSPLDTRNGTIGTYPCKAYRIEKITNLEAQTTASEL
jgi:hypothetical protein